MKVRVSIVLSIAVVFLLAVCGTAEPTSTRTPTSTLAPTPTRDAERAPASQPTTAPVSQADLAAPAPFVPGSGQGPGAGGRQSGGPGSGEALRSGQGASLVPLGPNGVRVVLPNQHNLQWMNFYVAQGAGFFEDEGLEIQVVVPPMPGTAAQFMAMGSAEVAVLTRSMYLDSIGRGEPMLAFANLLGSEPINLVVREEVAEERGLSADMPLADRLMAMRGLKIGVAPGPPTRLRVLFESVGLDADSDIEMVILQGDEQNPAFGQGRVDALYAHTPYLEKALVDQGAVMIVNQSAGEVPELANRQYHTLVTTQEYARANPQVLVSLARAIYRAQQLIHSDLRATAEAIRASEVQLLQPQGLETILAIYEPAMPQTPEVSVKGALRELELFSAHRTPPDLSGVDMTKHIDNQFAELAVRGTP